MYNPLLSCVDGTYPSIDCTYMRADTDDYEEQIRGCNQMRDVVIEQGMTKCYRQPIYDDVYFERTEYTGLSLEIKRRTAPTNIIQGHTQIKIVDTDSKLCTYYANNVKIHIFTILPHKLYPWDIRLVLFPCSGHCWV